MYPDRFRTNKTAVRITHVRACAPLCIRYTTRAHLEDWALAGHAHEMGEHRLRGRARACRTV